MLAGGCRLERAPRPCLLLPRLGSVCGAVRPDLTGWGGTQGPPLEIGVWWGHEQRNPVLAGQGDTHVALSSLPLFWGDRAELGLTLRASGAVASPRSPPATCLWPWEGASVGSGLTAAPKPCRGPVMAVGTASCL